MPEAGRTLRKCLGGCGAQPYLLRKTEFEQSSPKNAETFSKLKARPECPQS